MVAKQALMLVLNIQTNRIGGYGDYSEGAFGNWGQLMPFPSLQVMIRLVDEGVDL